MLEIEASDVQSKAQADTILEKYEEVRTDPNPSSLSLSPRQTE